MSGRYLYRVEVKTSDGWSLVRHYISRSGAKERAAHYPNHPTRILRSDPITWPAVTS